MPKRNVPSFDEFRRELLDEQVVISKMYSKMCKKFQYRNIESAEHYRAEYEKKRNVELHIYRCALCKQYHLTKQKQAGEVESDAEE